MQCAKNMKRLAPQTDLLQTTYPTDSSGTANWRRTDSQKKETGDLNVNKLNVSQMFAKKFHYQQRPETCEWRLPEPTNLFGEYYQLDSLQQLKQQLNQVKCKLNNYVLEEWSVHTRRQDPSSEIPWRIKNDTKAEFVTIAWCKFFECLHTFPLVKSPQLNTLHLCEVPGAFIAALNHYLHTMYKKYEIQWKWLSTSMNPYYEGNPSSGMITDDRFMFHTFDNWLMHNDFTGNIISRANIEQMRVECEKRLDGCVHLITADGSIDCMDAPDCQEEVVTPLHFAEIVAALSILADGGSFVIKFFTLFEATNVCKLFLLNCVFKEVHVFKPATSKRGNSEMYVVCIGYMKHTAHLSATLDLMKSKLECRNLLPLFCKADLPRDFLLQHEICMRLFMMLQIEAIESNIRTFEYKPTHREVHYKQTLRAQIANEFYTRYNVQPIPKEFTILHGEHIGPQNHKTMALRKGSYTEREMAKESSSLEEHIFNLHRKLNELDKTLDRGKDMLLMEKRSEHLDNLPELKVYRGAAYAAINSSVFVNTYMLQQYHKLKELLGIDSLWQETTHCDVDAKAIAIDLGCSDNYSRMQQKFFVSILEEIIEQRPAEVIFRDVPFLTHYAVSVLRFLSISIYEEFCIATAPTFEIRLRKTVPEYSDKEFTALINLRDLLANEGGVLCVLALNFLHRNDFYYALSEYNNLLLMRNLQQALKN